jgi:hypothetical protein
MTCQMTTSLGVYVLGAVDDRERHRLEAHLPSCPDCRAELAGLAPLTSALAQVPVKMLDLPQQRDHADRRRPEDWQPASRRRRKWTMPQLRTAAAAASLAAVAGAAAGFWLAAPTGTTAGPPLTETLSGANKATHVSASASLTATSWGTRIQLRMSGLPLNVPCRLIVRSRTGQTEVSGVWDAWRDGPISVPASAAWRPADIASLEVTTATRALVTIKSGQHLLAPPAPRHG